MLIIFAAGTLLATALRRALGKYSEQNMTVCARLARARYSMGYTPNALIDEKNILVTDYVGWGAQVFFYSTFSNDDDVPNGNSNKRRDFLSYSDSRTVVEDVFSGDLSHITTNDGYGGPLIIYHQYYAIAKHTSPEPVQGSWGLQENVIPEFPSLLVPGLFMMTTLIIVIAYKRKTLHFARYE